MNRFMSVVGILIIIAIVRTLLPHDGQNLVADRTSDRPSSRRNPKKRLNTTIQQNIYDTVIYVITITLLSNSYLNVSIYES